MSAAAFPDSQHTEHSDSDAPQSNADSLNSLLQNRDEDSRDDKCVDVECLENQCSLNCEDGGTGSQRRAVCCSPVSQVVLGCLLVLVSVGSFVFSPLDFMLWEKLNMRPGFPPYEWWRDPPDEVRLRVHVFNVTNHERWLAGVDQKIDVEEIGPIVYLEKLVHSDVQFNDNDTLTYTATRYPIYLPDENRIDLNATIIVPNLAVLGLASYLHNAPFFVRSGFRFLVNSRGSPLFVEKTIYEYLWEFTDPVLDLSKSLAPGLVPVSNMGMLARIYADFVDQMTVWVGPRWGHERFFQIHRFRGHPQLPGYDANECPDRITGSTEGVMYRQHLTKQDVLLYWRKTVCKLMPLYFDTELVVDDVPVYRYNLSEVVFSRVRNGTDCYDTEPSLPAGVSDASKCYYDFPMVISYPHFYTGEPARDRYVTGLQPNRDKHSSYVIVEPLTGTPFRSVARMQSNLRIHDLSGFSSEYDKFSNLILPLFWAEYNQEGLPDYIRLTIYYMVVVLPPVSKALLSFFLLCGCYLIAKQIYTHKLKSERLSATLPFKNKNVNNLARNKLFNYEKETFLKKPS
ncbi:scavenger receptor class B member 1-like isoform X2 [Plutella xylostella]|nr:scavenger receptor class B member 1-like isoform X2 [Plutella xylostella]